MLGFFRIHDPVSWTDDKHVLHYGIVVMLTDDELWADVCELGLDDVTQLPTALLNAMDEFLDSGRSSD